MNQQQPDKQENQESQPSDIDILIQEINISCNPKSSYYGQLVKWKSGEEWFYGIGLSDKAVFDTRNLDIRRDNTKKGAGLPIFIVKSYRSFFSQFEVIERLKYTLYYIDSKGSSAEFSQATWNGEYDENNWNDEHLSRFISNNEVISYKKHQSKGNSHKQKSLNTFLDINNPDSSSLSITDFYKISKTPKVIQRLLNDWRYWLFPLLIVVFFVSFAIKYYWISVGLMLTAFLIFVLSHLSRYEWSGFQNKRGWDWLALLIVPIVLAVAVNFVQNDMGQRQTESETSKNQQQLMLEYFKNVKDIVLKEKKDIVLRENHGGSNSSTQTDEVTLSPQAKKLIASFTKVLVPNITGVQKRQVIDFLYDLGMIKCEGVPQDVGSPVRSCSQLTYLSSKNNQKPSDNLINLSEVNFEKVDLHGMQLPNLYLPKVNLNEAIFTKSNLDGADLTDSSLNKANFDWASFRNASFVSPNISPNNDDPSQEKNYLHYLLKFFLSLLPTQPVQCVLPSSKLREVQKYQGYDRYYGMEKEEVKRKFRNVKDYDLNVNDAGLKERLLAFSKVTNYKNYKTCFSRLKLENLYLKDADFSGFDLRETSFKDSYLAGANINGANLEGTNLEGAYLKNIKIDDKYLKKLDEKTQLAIKLSNSGDPLEVIISELKKNKNLIDLTNLDLSTITIIGKDKTKKTELKSLNFKNARLVNSTLQNLDMSCDFQSSKNNSQEECKSANLDTIYLRKAKLTNIDLTGANLSSAVLMNTEINSLILKKADLFAANLTGAIINDTDFEGANFDSVILKGAKLKNIKNLNKVADFYAVDLSGAILNNVDLSNVNLNDFDLSNTELNEVNLSKANLAGAILYGADLSKAKNLEKVTSFKGASYCDKPSNNDTSPITKFPKKFNPKEKEMVVSCEPPTVSSIL